MPDEDPWQQQIRDAAKSAEQGEDVSLDDFVCYMPTYTYIFMPCPMFWPGPSVNARVPPVNTGRKGADGKPVYISASSWLAKNRPVEAMTWAPGEPMVIPDRLIAEGGWIPRKGVKCFNQYRAPTLVPRSADGSPTCAVSS